jgi:hypothetical protein
MKTETFNRLHEQRHRGETVHPQLESSLCERTVNVDLEDVNWTLTKGSKHYVIDWFGMAWFDGLLKVSTEESWLLGDL